MTKSACCSLGTKEQKLSLEKLMKSATKKSYSVVRVLEEVQKIYGYLPESVLVEVSRLIDVPVSELCSVASFYAEFSFSPKGRFPISVCLGTACYVKGAKEIFDKICMELGIKEGETTADGRFSIDQTRCVGCCGMSPVLTVGEEIYGNVKISEVVPILKKYMEK